MRINTIPCLSDNYSYLIVAGDGSSVVVDPSEARPVEAAIESQNADLLAVWLTHHHHDHTGGVETLCRRYGALEVIGSAFDLQGGRIAGQTTGVAGGDRLRFADRGVDVIAAPGHTLGHVAYLIDGSLFTGDTLFLAGCGRVFEGSMEVMFRTLETLRKLPPSTRIFCGHEYTIPNLEFARTVEPHNPEITRRAALARELRDGGEPTVPGSLADELIVNPFLRWDAEPVREAARRFGARDGSPAEIFSSLRRAKDRF